MHQMKEHGKNPQDQTNEEKIGSIPEKQFKIVIVKMVKRNPQKRNGENAKIK